MDLLIRKYGESPYSDSYRFVSLSDLLSKIYAKLLTKWIGCKERQYIAFHKCQVIMPDIEKLSFKNRSTSFDLCHSTLEKSYATRAEFILLFKISIWYYKTIVMFGRRCKWIIKPVACDLNVVCYMKTKEGRGNGARCSGADYLRWEHGLINYTDIKVFVGFS